MHRPKLQPPLLTLLIAAAPLASGCGIDDPYAGGNAPDPYAVPFTGANTDQPVPRTPAPTAGAAAVARLSAARQVAGRFATAYIRYLYKLDNQLAARDLTPRLRAEVRRLPALRGPLGPPSPPPRVRDLAVTKQTADRAVARLLVDDASDLNVPLSFVLERTDGRWRVASLSH